MLLEVRIHKTFPICQYRVKSMLSETVVNHNQTPSDVTFVSTITIKYCISVK